MSFPVLRLVLARNHSSSSARFSFPDTPSREKIYIIKSQRRSPESEHKNLYSSKYIASATFSLVTTMPTGVRRNDKKNFFFTLSLCAFANTFSCSPRFPGVIWKLSDLSLCVADEGLEWAGAGVAWAEGLLHLAAVMPAAAAMLLEASIRQQSQYPRLIK
jgi:hypothetical protein